MYIPPWILVAVRLVTSLKVIPGQILGVHNTFFHSWVMDLFTLNYAKHEQLHQALNLVRHVMDYMSDLVLYHTPAMLLHNHCEHQIIRSNIFTEFFLFFLHIQPTARLARDTQRQ